MSNSKFFAGVGARGTPRNILKLMALCATKLETQGYTLSSGGAYGADSAFEEGIKDPRNKRIYLAMDCTKKAEEYSMKLHPAPERCSPQARKLHGRNAMILLGENLDAPVEFVLCWTEDGKTAGGTGQAIRIAKENGIPVFNMANPNWTKQVEAFKAQKQGKVIETVKPTSTRFEDLLAKGKLSLDPENSNYYRR